MNEDKDLTVDLAMIGIGCLVLSILGIIAGVILTTIIKVL